MEQEREVFVCLLTNTKNRTSFCLHFNQAIPRLDYDWFYSDSILTRSPRKQQTLASRLAKINQGNMATELVRPYDAFASLIAELNRIDGLVSIRNSNLYTMEYGIGLLFDATAIGQRIATNIHSHFFWEQTFSFSLCKDFATKSPEVDSEKSLPVEAKEPTSDSRPS
jgi:hypothetical protein